MDLSSLTTPLDIKIIKHYGIRDTVFIGDYNVELIVNEKSIIYGNEGKDKTFNQIIGFLKSLDFFNIKYKKLTTKKADVVLW